MVKPSRCRTCGLPVTGYYEEGGLATLTPCGHTFAREADPRPPAEQTQLPPGSRPVQPRAATPLVERVAEHMYLAVMQATRDVWPLWIHLPAPAQENWRRDAARALGLRDDSL